MVGNHDRSVAFYKAVFGMEVSFTDGDILFLRSPGGRDDLALHLAVTDQQRERVGQHGGYEHFTRGPGDRGRSVAGGGARGRLPTCQRAFGPDFLAGGFRGELAAAAFLLFDFGAIWAGLIATDFLGAALVFDVAFFVVGVLAFALVGAFAAERPGLTLAAPGDRLRVLPRTVSVPGPGIRLVSSPDSHRTCSMLPLVDKTTPSLGPDLDATDTLSPTSATPSPHLAEGPSIGRWHGVHKPGTRP